jgi:hypothetical protein
MKRTRDEDGEVSNQTVLPLTKKQKIGQNSNDTELFAVIQKGSENIIFKTNTDEFTVSIEDMMNWIKTRNIITIKDDYEPSQEGLLKSSDTMNKEEMQNEGEGFTCDGCRKYFCEDHSMINLKCDGCRKYFCEDCVDYEDNFSDIDSDDTLEQYIYCHHCNPNTI